LYILIFAKVYVVFKGCTTWRWRYLHHELGNFNILFNITSDSMIQDHLCFLICLMVVFVKFELTQN